MWQNHCRKNKMLSQTWGRFVLCGYPLLFVSHTDDYIPWLTLVKVAKSILKDLLFSTVKQASGEHRQLIADSVTIPVLRGESFQQLSCLSEGLLDRLSRRSPGIFEEPDPGRSPHGYRPVNVSRAVGFGQQDAPGSLVRSSSAAASSAARAWLWASRLSTLATMHFCSARGGRGNKPKFNLVSLIAG